MFTTSNDFDKYQEKIYIDIFFINYNVSNLTHTPPHYSKYIVLTFLLNDHALQRCNNKDI